SLATSVEAQITAVNTPTPTAILKYVCPTGTVSSTCNYIGAEGIRSAMNDAVTNTRIIIKSGTYTPTSTYGTSGRTIRIEGQGSANTIISGASIPSGNGGAF